MSNRSHRILVVDDNAAIHQDFQKIFSDVSDTMRLVDEASAMLFGEAPPPESAAAYRLDFASQGAEGLEMVRAALQSGDPYSVAFMDVRMPPGWNGIETTARIWEVDPDLQIIICTAYSDHSLDQINARLGHSDRFVILKKPFDSIEVRQMANAFVEKWRLSRQAKAHMRNLEGTVQSRTEDLGRSDSRYRLFFDSNPLPTWVFDRDTLAFLAVNDAAVQHYGYSREEFLGMKATDVRPKEDLAGFLEFMASGGQIVVNGDQWRHRKKDGTIILAEITAHPIHFEGQDAVLVVAHDVTERKLAEDALKESERRFRDTLANLDLVAMTLDVNGAITFCNDHLLRLTGWERDQTIGRDWFAQFIPETDHAVKSLFFDAIRDGTIPPHHENPIKTKTGELREIAWNNTLLRDTAGNVVGTASIGEDITERKRAAQRLTSALNYNQLLLEASPIGVITYRGTGEVVSANPAVAKMIGATVEQVTAQNFRELESWKKSGLFAAAEKALETNQPQAVEVHHQTTFGKVLWISAHLVPFEYEGRPHLLGLFADVTQQKQADEKLRLQTSALEAAAEAIVITDPAGVIAWVNPAFQRLTGYTAAETIGKTSALLKSDKHPREFYTMMWKMILSGIVWQGELINRRKDGVLYHEEMTITPVFGRSGRIENFVAIKRDISKRKEVEEVLASERDVLKSLMDATLDHVYFKDIQSRFTRINAAHARHLGLPSPEAAIGKRDTDFFAIRFGRQTFVDEQRLLTTGEPIVDRVEEWPLPDGHAAWFSTTKVPLRSRDGQITGLVGVSRDITARKHMEEQLAYERDLLRTLMEHSQDMIYFKDIESRFLMCSKPLAKRFGFDRMEDALGKTDADFFGEEHAREAFEDEQAIIRTGKPLVGKIEKESLKSDGRTTWALTNKMPLRDKEGRIIGTFGISKDITELKEAEQTRQLMEVQLRNAQKLEAIGQLAAGIAHEINTPTQYVGDNTRFLQDSFKDLSHVLESHRRLLQSAQSGALTPQMLAEAEQLVATADLDYLSQQIPAAIRESLEGVERVTKIVRAMKEFSHPGNKDKSPADINKAIESTVTVARNEWKYVSDMKLELDPALPRVPCYLGQFNQAILNLVINAAHSIGDVIKSKPGSKGTITIRTRRDGDWAEVSVSDNGTGIPEAVRPRIFEPFFTTKAVGKGTGQGLSIIYTNIVKKLGGTVSFETEIGQGTTFILRLPLAARVVETPVAKPDSSAPEYVDRPPEEIIA